MAGARLGGLPRSESLSLDVLTTRYQRGMFGVVRGRSRTFWVPSGYPQPRRTLFRFPYQYLRAKLLSPLLAPSLFKDLNGFSGVALLPRSPAFSKSILQFAPFSFTACCEPLGEARLPSGTAHVLTTICCSPKASEAEAASDFLFAFQRRLSVEFHVKPHRAQRFNFVQDFRFNDARRAVR